MARCSSSPLTGPFSSSTSHCREPDMKLAKASALLGLVLSVTAATGCAASNGGDKAGGPAGGAVVLRMASGSSSPTGALADFIRDVGVVSGGSMQIKVINQWGEFAPSNEAQVVHAVAAGTVDLG